MISEAIVLPRCHHPYGQSCERFEGHRRHTLLSTTTPAVPQARRSWINESSSTGRGEAIMTPTLGWAPVSAPRPHQSMGLPALPREARARPPDRVARPR